MKMRFQSFWREASGGTRVSLTAVLLVAGLGGVAGLFHEVGDDGMKVAGAAEPTVLSRKPIEASFGLGDGVTYARPDRKVFGFELFSAIQAVVILHFQSSDISEGEVVVTVNGADVGKVPADGLDALGVSHEIAIPPNLLKPAQRNELAFDNVRNPPGTDPWRIWNLWIETIPLPEESLEELLCDAQTSYARAEMEVAAGNHHEAWKDYRDAWLKLDAHPDPKPELYQMSWSKMHEAQFTKAVP